MLANIFEHSQINKKMPFYNHFTTIVFLNLAAIGDPDLYFNQAVVFIEDAIQVKVYLPYIYFGPSILF